ncbi:tetratricopeptide repeat protein [Cohaesibacter sp. CAU 1516]|uniref:tetratricopeptide repeat protein n=1 Tax=Cohaesibacter sp. CAU 1516 TaxID=2576038 RepID=UPI0014850784|nr:tetratricopeptide repeat protein [Cohaesibacter sp. CAU 1516]
MTVTLDRANAYIRMHSAFKIPVRLLAVALCVSSASAQTPEKSIGNATTGVEEADAGTFAGSRVVAPTNSDNPFNLPQLKLSPGLAFSAYQRGYYLSAFDLATKLAAGGERSAMTLLGELYLNGQGVPQDVKEAANWFQLAADKGDPEAQFSLGLLHARGRGVEKNIDKAVELFTKAAENGQKNAQFNLAYMALQGQQVRRDVTRALDLFTKSAKQGLADSQYALATLYQSNLFPTPNLEQASYWMHKAAQNGFTDAQLEYGLMLFKGRGVKKDYGAGQAWIEQAANAGHVIAQNRLARILAHGFDNPPEPIKAARYYLLSKRAGLNDDWLEDFFQKLPNADKQQALKSIQQSGLWSPQSVPKTAPQTAPPAAPPAAPQTGKRQP